MKVAMILKNANVCCSKQEKEREMNTEKGKQVEGFGVEEEHMRHFRC